MVSFLMKQFQILKEISCLKREENGLPRRKDDFIDRIKKNYGGHVRTGLLPEELQEIKFESPVTIIGYEIVLTKAFAILCSLHFLAL